MHVTCNLTIYPIRSDPNVSVPHLPLAPINLPQCMNLTGITEKFQFFVLINLDIAAALNAPVIGLSKGSGPTEAGYAPLTQRDWFDTIDES